MIVRSERERYPSRTQISRAVSSSANDPRAIERKFANSLDPRSLVALVLSAIFIGTDDAARVIWLRETQAHPVRGCGKAYSLPDPQKENSQWILSTPFDTDAEIQWLIRSYRPGAANHSKPTFPTSCAVRRRMSLRMPEGEN